MGGRPASLACPPAVPGTRPVARGCPSVQVRYVTSTRSSGMTRCTLLSFSGKPKRLSRLRKRHLRHCQRLQHARQAHQLLVRDSSPNSAGIVQTAILGVVAQQQRANVRPARRLCYQTCELRLDPSERMSRRSYRYDAACSVSACKPVRLSGHAGCPSITTKVVRGRCASWPVSNVNWRQS